MRTTVSRYLLGLILALPLISQVIVMGQQPSGDKNPPLGASDKDWKKWMDAQIFPRDIFSVLEKFDRGERVSDVRGWKLNFNITWQFLGSVDSEEYIVTCTKGKETAYFHVSHRSGVDTKTGQSLYEIHVKQVKTPEEDWNHNFNDDLGEWDKDHRIQWIPFKSDPTKGTCNPDPELSISPTSKESCFNPTENK